jgi:hypothetical protein
MGEEFAGLGRGRATSHRHWHVENAGNAKENGDLGIQKVRISPPAFDESKSDDEWGFAIFSHQLLELAGRWRCGAGRTTLVADSLLLINNSKSCKPTNHTRSATGTGSEKWQRRTFWAVSSEEEGRFDEWRSKERKQEFRDGAGRKVERGWKVRFGSLWPPRSKASS